MDTHKRDRTTKPERPRALTAEPTKPRGNQDRDERRMALAREDRDRMSR